MSVQGKAQRLDIRFGPKYNTVVVYSPKQHPGAGFVCFEDSLESSPPNILTVSHRSYHSKNATMNGDITR